MAAGVDPNEIHGFLHSIARDSHSGYNSPRYSAPHQPANNNLIGDGSVYSYSSASQSDETASYASTVNYTMSVPSIFSRYSVGGRSSVGSAPSVGVNQQTLDQHVAAGPRPHQGAGDLWCEFSVLFNCNVTFRLDDAQSWIYHHIAHLGGGDRYPAKSTCWFCDDVRFTASRPVDTYTKFWERMEHIHSHIMHDDRLTSRDVRPDFYVLKHLYETGLISEETYHYAMNYEELPRSLRLPESSAAAPSSSYRQAGPLDRGQPYDHQKEERRERRHKRELKKEKSNGQERRNK